MNPSLLLIPDRYKASKLYSQIPDSGAGDFLVTRGTTATRVNASGLIESVASGVPRIDYTGGGCGKLLVEPAATNLFLRSEQINDAAWVKVAGTVTENNSLAPDGAMTADTFTADGTNASHRFFQAVTAVSGTTYRVSYYVKRGTAEYVQIAISGAIPFGVTNFANFDLLLGVVGTTGGNQTNSQISYNAATGYYRISSQITATGTGAGQIDLVIVSSASAPRAQAWVTSQSIICWGAQLEVGSVATSYIPTVASTVTRNADVISVSSVSGLIGQGAGTIYAEVDLRRLPKSTNVVAVYLCDSGDNANSRVAIGVNTLGQYNAQLGATVIASGTVTSGIHKIALGYDAAVGIKLFVDGALVAQSTGATTVIPITVATLGGRPAGSNIINDRISAAAVYTSRLSDSELQSLTQL